MHFHRRKIVSIALCIAAGFSMAAPALAQDAASARQLSDFIECKLDAAKVAQFNKQLDAKKIVGFTQSKEGADAALMLWQTPNPVAAWGEKSVYFNFLHRKELHLAYKVPKGEELKLGKALIDRIGGMKGRADAASLEASGWKGLDYRKPLPGDKTVRVIVDESYAPGWISVGCAYGSLIE